MSRLQDKHLSAFQGCLLALVHSCLQQECGPLTTTPTPHPHHTHFHTHATLPQGCRSVKYGCLHNLDCCMMKPCIRGGKCAVSAAMHTLVCIQSNSPCVDITNTRQLTAYKTGGGILERMNHMVSCSKLARCIVPNRAFLSCTNRSKCPIVIP